MNNTIYELSNYDYMYDCNFYYQFKNDETVVGRIKGFLRESLRYGSVYDDVRDNMVLLHKLKQVNTIAEVKGILGVAKTGWDLEEKELL